ncbi:hypothetical protein IQ06DRAFT_34521 [Phaeosphaeriaceae sp. SRC1lsM3a]|nr:hypothetical protein IQ06DRAFT_34521 [Stagonospora sp. SRC1lsM3a]
MFVLIVHFSRCLVLVLDLSTQSIVRRLTFDYVILENFQSTYLYFSRSLGLSQNEILQAEIFAGREVSNTRTTSLYNRGGNSHPNTPDLDSAP